MAALRQRQPWPLFAIKAACFTALIVLAAWTFSSQFAIAFDFQKERCLDGSRLMILDLRDRTPRRGQVFAFRSPDLAPVFGEGTLMAKAVQGLPGDRVRITLDERIHVNGIEVARGLPYAGRLGFTPAAFVKEFVVPADSVLVLGTTQTSFDGRYWGTLETRRLRGRAYQFF